jgi:hypothetical protein
MRTPCSTARAVSQAFSSGDPSHQKMLSGVQSAAISCTHSVTALFVQMG